MKKLRTAAALAAVALMGASVIASSCGTSISDEDRLPFYQGDTVTETGSYVYNKDLFYTNAEKKISGADPFVLDNTAQDGYYYAYVTSGFFDCYRSPNLVDWEAVGPSLGVWKMDRESEQFKAFNKDLWAPEVVYDKDVDGGTYYLYFSASPTTDANAAPANGIPHPASNERHTNFSLFVAKSKSPEGPFLPVDFSDKNSCGEGNTHTYNTKTNIPATNEKYSVEGFKPAYPHYFAKYLFLNPEKYNEFAETTGLSGQRSGGFTGAIDPHPFVSSDGRKWMYFVDNVGTNGICVVEMENWLKPKWDTVKLLTVARYNTIADYRNGSKNYTSYENSNNSINEGPEVLERNGKFYLTFSVNDYAKSDYCVGIAVADAPDGDFRKLTEQEGGLFLSSKTIESQSLSGTGHHSFTTAGEQLYVMYHRHNDYAEGGGARNAAVDEVKWITIKDKDGNNLEVPYVNGATDSVQPLPEKFSAYQNVADKAEVTASEKDVDVSFLTDGLLSVLKTGDDTFMSYIGETQIAKTTTFTFAFQDYKTMRAIMVYNSRDEYVVFQKISRIELVCEVDGKEVTKYITNVKFNLDAEAQVESSGEITYIRSGSAAYAEFDEIKVKTVKITVDVPEGQDGVGISEIRLLAKKEG